MLNTDPYKNTAEEGDVLQKESIIAQELSSYSMIERFDSACCRLLANKPILAWLLRDTVEDYHSCSIDKIIDCLEGAPQVRTVPVDQDVKNRETGKIIGDNTADKSVTEGLILYDILFTSRLPKTDETCQIIVNVENQNQWRPGYPLLKQAVYYSSRLISRQKGTVFFGDDYGKMEKVYSIWICIKVPKTWQNTLTVFSLEPKSLVGTGKYDKMEYNMETVAVLGLGDHKSPRKDILKLLSVLLTPTMDPDEKRKILEQDYQIPMTVEMKKEADTMCTYGQSILEEGLQKGRLEGKQEGRLEGRQEGKQEGLLEGRQKEREANILGMLKEKIPMETISRITHYSLDQIQKLGKLHGLL